MQSKYWLITDNINHGKEAWTTWWEQNSVELTYFVIKLESAPSTGHLHGQGFLITGIRKRIHQVIDLLLPGCHVERMKGTVADCIKYVKKAETTVPEEDGGYLLEFGAAPMSEQGKRNDLERIRNESITAVLCYCCSIYRRKE